MEIFLGMLICVDDQVCVHDSWAEEGRYSKIRNNSTPFGTLDVFILEVPLVFGTFRTF